MRKLFASILGIAVLFASLPISAESAGADVINADITNNACAGAIGSQSFTLLDNSARYMCLRARGGFAEKSENTALRIVYLDSGSNFIRVRYRVKSGANTPVRTRLIHKSASGELREAVILINRGVYDGNTKVSPGGENADIVIDSYDTHSGKNVEYIREAELTELGGIPAEDSDGRKQRIFYKSASCLLGKIGLIDPDADLGTEASTEDINTAFSKITGLCADTEQNDMESVLKAWLAALGYPTAGNIKNRAAEAGLIRSVIYSPAFYGRSSGRELQNFGVATVSFEETQKVYRDELAGLMYNLLFVKPKNGEKRFMTRLAENDAGFEERLLSLNDYLISNTYYDDSGIKISEKEITDGVTGEKITCLYLKGGNVNAAYVNEFTSVDGENFALCAAYDKRIGTGIPVVYNTRLKTTTELSRGGGITPFAMLVSRQNIVYWTEGAALFSYDINTGNKKTVFTEPDGAPLQEVPTVTDDGKYITVFCGKTVSYQPDTVYRVNTESGAYETVIDAEWTKKPFSGSKNPHLGHVIINPKNHEIINFMHGGGDNVTDRLWLIDGSRIYQPYVQKMKSFNNLYFGEHITHAFWSSDGKRLYFLRPPASSSSVENGITYVDITEKSEYDPDNETDLKTAAVHNGDFSYIHTSADGGGMHFVSDTQIVFDNGRFRNEIVFYSEAAKKARLLAYVPVWNAHPCHSHPTFTADGKKALFNMADDETESCMVGVMNISDIAEALDSGEKDNHGKIAWLDCKSSFGMLGITAERYKREYISGRECISVSDSIGAEVFGSFVKKDDACVTVMFKYFDDGTESIAFEYNTNSASEDAAVKNRKRILIPKSGSKEWKTAELCLTDASFRSANADNTDFRIISLGKPLYISDVAVFSGASGRTEFSYPETVGGELRMSVINPEKSDKALYVFSRRNDGVGVKRLTVQKQDFAVLHLGEESAEQFFVWDAALRPIEKRQVLSAEIKRGFEQH